MRQFHESGDLDIAYTADGLPRFRVNAFRQRGAISFAFRVIPRDVPSFERLNMPPGVARLANEHRGLVLVTGATGSGKTTTLASMLDHINQTRSSHIVTIEDPIEILHSDRMSIVNQREVGLDTADFAQALRRVLRQDPDTILIGELRDAETAQTALQAAESGHLVFSTLHTIDAAETVGRMIEFFPPAKQQQIRSVLAGVLRGVISQRLLPRVDHGRVAAVEVMVMNARISDLIREQRTEEIADAVAEGGFFDMQTFEQALIDLVLTGKVEREVAANAATNVHDFEVALDQAVKRQAVEVAQRARECRGGRGGGRGARAPRHPSRGGVMRRLVAAALADPRAGSRNRVGRHVRRRSRQLRRSHGWTVVLPSAEVPNAAGSILLPPGAWESAFLPVRELAYEELQGLWVRAGTAYGIPWQVLAAINKIESNFGRNMGPSSAGAVGWMQFMPDTWLRWGMDGNGDGIADPWNPEDAIHSAARYLAAANGRTDISRAIFAYNHAQWYVDDVLQLAAMFGGDLAGADAVFSLDRMAVALEEAQEQVAALAEQLAAAEAVESELGREGGTACGGRRRSRAASLRPRARGEGCVPGRGGVRSGYGRGGQAPRRARAGAGWRSRPPAAAPSRRRSRPRPPACCGCRRGQTAMSSRSAAGPDAVSVGHHHHDYPAADIAAPHGAPLYALADGIVLAVVDDGRCGTGLVLQTVDGLEWVYCHLSYRDPGVAQGSFLSAGQWVGLVGSTGHSTGPHLHLGLRPARYPQEMPWFQEFAGIAFTWQDAPTEPDVRTTPVFAPVPPEEPLGDVVEFTLSRG